jgi:hypothetical protein
MPNLPTFTVTDAQAARLLAAFGSTENYKAWLKQQLTAYVLDKETEAERATFQNNVNTKRGEIDGMLT